MGEIERIEEGKGFEGMDFIGEEVVGNILGIMSFSVDGIKESWLE